MNGEKCRATIKKGGVGVSYSLLEKNGGGEAAYFRYTRKKPSEERYQSPADSCVLHCTSGGGKTNCEAIHLVPNQSRACTNERRQGRID